MQPALDSTTMDRLIALGREQGHLTNQDLQANLPIDAMSAEDIALIVVHLEETGVPVELDDNLAAPNPKADPVPVRTAEIIPFPDRSTAARMKRKPGLQQKGNAPQTEAPKAVGQGKGAAHWATAASGLFVLILLGTLVVLFGV